MTRTRPAVLIAVLIGLLIPASAGAQWPPPLGGVSPRQNTAAAESRIALGLTEALKVGADNAVARTGRLDGFFKNEVIRILMPEKLRRLETGHVVGKTLDGLFYVLGEEERAIRRDPAARVTAILREVFGR